MATELRVRFAKSVPNRIPDITGSFLEREERLVADEEADLLACELSFFVGCSTGKSAGLAPLRILSR